MCWILMVLDVALGVRNHEVTRTRRRPSKHICTMLDQRRRRWADVVQIVLYKCFVFAGEWLKCPLLCGLGLHSVADPGFEKGEGAGACPQDFFGQFKVLFKEFGAKRGGRAPPAPPSGSAPDSVVNSTRPILAKCLALLGRRGSRGGAQGAHAHPFLCQIL